MHMPSVHEWSCDMFSAVLVWMKIISKSVLKCSGQKFFVLTCCFSLEGAEVGVLMSICDATGLLECCSMELKGGECARVCIWIHILA